MPTPAATPPATPPATPSPASPAATLAELTTLRVGGPARELVIAETESEILDAVRATDASATPLLVVGGGSNLVVSDEGFAGTVVVVRSRGIEVTTDTCGGAFVEVAAGEPWDAFVEYAVAHGWSGVEALSGIPGAAGATPIQNVGAYGQDVAETIARVRVWDRVDQQVRTFANTDCGFGYRTSRFKQDPDRHVVLSVTFQLPLGTLGAPVGYGQLAETLGVATGQRAPAAQVREAVLALRRSKAMVLDPADHDTWSTGSFFTNPLVAADLVPEGASAWPQPAGTVKVSAAWLIEHAGFDKGYGNERVRLSSKHTLAITNRGTARARDVVELARQVRAGVQARFGIALVNEPVLVGLEL